MRGVRLLEARSDAWIIEAGAGENWHGFVSACMANGWDGLENLALIPGTVGAAPVQNIGAYGVELAERFLGLTAWNVRQRRLVDMDAAACRYAYRSEEHTSELQSLMRISYAVFCLKKKKTNKTSVTVN